MAIGEIVIPDSFDSLSTQQVLRMEQLLGALWSAADNTVDVRTGALQALVLQPFATLLESSREAFRIGGQLSDLSYLSSASAFDERADRLLDFAARNYRITRKTGDSSSGRIRLVFSRRATISVSPSDTFTANGIQFIPIQQFTADSREGFIGGDVHFHSMPDESGYVFIDISVVALQNGVAGNLVRGAELLPEQGNIPHFVRAFAIETFTGGANDESNHDLIQRMIHGISAKVLSSRTNMRASLLETFPDIRDSSVIGAGDEEMTRDKHTVFPGATGGYVDWYVATSRQLQWGRPRVLQRATITGCGLRCQTSVMTSLKHW